MSRYINADKAIKQFKELHGDESNLLNCYNADWIVQFIEGQIVTDAQEVKHAKWLPYRFGLEVVRCSNCGAVYEDGDSFRFCPRCGAKMDGKE